MDKRVSEKRMALALYVTLHLLTVIVLMRFSAVAMLTRNDRVAMVVVAFLADGAFVYGGSSEEMQKYKGKGPCLAIGLVSLYSACASFAYRLFLTGDQRPCVYWQGIGYLLLVTVYFLPVIWGLLFAVELLAHRLQVKYAPNQISKGEKSDFWILFAVLMGCELFLLYAFWPGGWSCDVVGVLREADVGGLNDWQPVLYTLMFRAVMRAGFSPVMVLIGKMAGFAALNAAVLVQGRKRGLPIWLLALVGCIWELLPNSATQAVSADKDFPYTLALLWGCYLLFRFVSQKEVSKKLWYKFSLGVDLFLMIGLRHNGFVPVLFLAAFCLIATLKYWKTIKTSLAISAVCAMAAVGIFKGPIYGALNVYPNMASTYTTMVCAVASCINKDLPLSEKTTQKMESVMPLEVWKDYYGRFVGHDFYLWGEGNTYGQIYLENMQKITAQDAFYMYFDAFIRYPDVVIKDRLDGMNIMWDVKQPSESFNLKDLTSIYNYDWTENYFDLSGLEQDVWGAYYNDAAVATCYRKSFIQSTDSVIDLLLWRTGGYLIFLLVLVIYWHKNKMNYMHIAALPLWGNIAASMLVLYHQSFRYVYFIQVLTMALLFMTLCAPGKDGLMEEGQVRRDGKM